MKEVWRDIPGYEGFYKASSQGRIRSVNRVTSTKKCEGKILRQYDKGNGYYVISLCKNGNQKTNLVHRVIAQTFLENTKKLPQVNHKNGIKSDNRLINLEWCSRSENIQHAFKNGLIKSPAKGLTGYKSSKGKEIHQFDLDGNHLNTFGSARQAAISINASRSSITMCATGKIKTSAGYRWEYA